MVEIQSDSINTLQRLMKWIFFNLALLGCYLGFFHLCLIFDFPWSLLIGAAVAHVMIIGCVRFRHLFVNRFEFLVYLVFPLDILLEGLIPIHQGYSFYFCAVSFWMLFILYRTYHWIFRTRQKQIGSSTRQPKRNLNKAQAKSKPIDQRKLCIGLFGRLRLLPKQTSGNSESYECQFLTRNREAYDAKT